MERFIFKIKERCWLKASTVFLRLNIIYGIGSDFLKEIYFDHSATTAVKRGVLNEMIPYFNLEYGNPSSLYYIGREAKRAIECARRKVARAINCCEEEVYFTSCGSESDNLAIKGFAYANR